jgi:hypothetical protein
MGNLGSFAEDLFVELFCDTFGPDQAEYLFLQYPVTDIYGNRRSTFDNNSPNGTEAAKWFFEKLEINNWPENLCGANNVNNDLQR